MRTLKLGFGVAIPLFAWLAAACLAGAGSLATSQGVSAQTMVPPAGQARVTAPGGRKRRPARGRHRTGGAR